ncbi:hypothetical protein B7G68_00950 [Caulobacter segnis]|jgi:hypothetical protein|uniref:Uncharacterized protein n=2 Tax=Caulobacter segnis TaxID=88688 RepID=D5VE01_CAUST|nr:hypothetical protein [Caulobacter segnis]ADG08701.1 hypothetical protein Cseg_0175 [Caulobacter segnis ATCC 21756]AVQ00551.1 hypothetical protein B7G68_00950 [Caulobacter segnis]
MTQFVLRIGKANGQIIAQYPPATIPYPAFAIGQKVIAGHTALTIADVTHRLIPGPNPAIQTDVLVS